MNLIHTCGTAVSRSLDVRAVGDKRLHELLVVTIAGCNVEWCEPAPILFVDLVVITTIHIVRFMYWYVSAFLNE